MRRSFPRLIGAAVAVWTTLASVASATASHEIVMGFLCDRTGATQTVGVNMCPGAQDYVRLVNAKGVKLINEQTFPPGATIPTERGPKLLLTLGNASVQMKVDGKAVAVNPSPTAIRLMITPSRVSHIPQTQTPTCP